MRIAVVVVAAIVFGLLIVRAWHYEQQAPVSPRIDAPTR